MKQNGRNIHERNREAAGLRAIRMFIPQHDPDGNDLWEALDFQISMLAGRATLTEAVETGNDYLISCAVDANDWLQGDYPAPSRVWRMDGKS